MESRMTLEGMPASIRTRKAWTALVLGVAAQTAGTVFVSTPAFLIPLLHTERGISLAQAGLLAAIPTMGMVITLILWGALADRVGEKWVIAAGLVGVVIAAAGAMTAHGYVELGAFLLLGGAASASSNSASGKVVVGWFPKERRGLAMGIRQMCQPLGVTIAALTVPAIAAGSGLSAAFVIPLVMTALLVILTAVFLANPPRDAKAVGAPPAANPYRTSGFLWRIHLVSILLVVPQFTLSVFGLVWLITQLHVPTLAAGVLVGVAQFVGALGRVAVGILSDRVASRMRPLRWVAISAVVVMVGLGLTAAAEWQVGAIVLVIAMTVTVADNGLAFTSVAEMAGPSWSGRALGAQNTGQFIAASVVGPLVGGLIGLVGYPIAFLLVAVVPAIAVPIIPKQSAEIDRL